ncbi:hypothetical protein N9361_01865 [Alphaproteobacteria bacterium]|nr:hypothetical protein [Alphaproteobacteria bacterium]
MKESHLGILASIFLVSNRPENLHGLIASIENTANDPSRLELLVKIDNGDEATEKILIDSMNLKLNIKYICSPSPDSHFELWRSLNDLYKIVDPTAYFLCNVNDELRFVSKGWDSVLARHVGFFSDDIFRLRVSRFKLRNYIDVWECMYAPENYAFHTKKWVDIQGDWNACHVSDAFQQCVAYYLALSNYPNPELLVRDIPVWGIDFENQEAAVGLSPGQMQQRNEGNDAAWYRLMGAEMQTEICKRARLLQGNIFAAEIGLTEYSVHDNQQKKYVEFRDVEGKTVIVYSYRVDERKIESDLARERMHDDRFHYQKKLNYINEVENFAPGLTETFPGLVHNSSRPNRSFKQ